MLRRNFLKILAAVPLLGKITRQPEFELTKAEVGGWAFRRFDGSRWVVVAGSLPTSSTRNFLLMRRTGTKPGELGETCAITEHGYLLKPGTYFRVRAVTS